MIVCMRGNWMLIAGIVAILAAGGGAITWWFANQAGPKKQATTAPQVTLPPSNPNEISLAGKIQAHVIVASG